MRLALLGFIECNLNQVQIKFAAQKVLPTGVSTANPGITKNMCA